jgi:hypothetical protein
MEEQLPAGLGEGKIAEFIEDDEVEPGKMIGNAALPAGTGLGLEPVDQVDDIEEAPACAVADERTGNGDCQMRLAGACPADQDDIALIGDEGAGGEVADQALVDRRAGKIEVLDILGQRKLGDGELVLDGTGLLLGTVRNSVLEAMMMERSESSHGYREGSSGPAACRPRSDRGVCQRRVAR